MKDCKPILSATILAGLAIACGPLPEDAEFSEEIDTDQTKQALAQGWETNLRPEVGRFRNYRQDFCTATLIHPQVAITAASCLNKDDYQDTRIGNDMEFRSEGHHFKVEKVHSFGYRRQTGGFIIPWKTIDGDLDTNIALLKLATPVPPSVATPVSLAARKPRNNERMTLLGYRCNRWYPHFTSNERYYWGFRYPNETRALCGQAIGGPLFIGDLSSGKALWAVGSGSAPGVSSPALNPPDVFADVLGHKPQIEEIIRQWTNTAYEVGFNRPGGTYRSILLQQGGLPECQRECFQDPQCRAFSLKVNPTPYPNYCELKERASTLVAAEGYISQTTPAIKKGYTFVRNPYATITSASSAEICAQKCMNRSSCYTWRFEGSTCTLDTQTIHLTATPADHTSGHKISTWERNTFRDGSTYRTQAASSVQDCKKKCAEDSACAAFGYRSGNCSFKEVGGVPRSRVGYTSGLRRGLEMNTNRLGSDYRNFALATPDPERCQTACARESRCKVFTYVPPRPAAQGTGYAHCWLKDAIPPAYSTMGMVSGYYTLLLGSGGSPRGWYLDAPNTHRRGGTFAQAAASTPGACLSRCSSDSRCKAYTWVPASASRGAYCELKNIRAPLYETRNMVSGIKGLEFTP